MHVTHLETILSTVPSAASALTRTAIAAELGAMELVLLPASSGASLLLQPEIRRPNSSSKLTMIFSLFIYDITYLCNSRWLISTSAIHTVASPGGAAQESPG